MRPALLANSLFMIAAMLLLFSRGISQSDDRSFIDSIQYKILRVKPSSTNPAIHTWDSVHVVYYDPLVKSNKILLWLTGTGGTTGNIPVDFFIAALSQGYRVIALS